jgi:ATP-dependent Clp protease ATP-binding subunit ClpC
MSEFMEQHSVSKLIGAPPGYVGYSDGNHITEQVRKKPYSVILFDEIEKAHVDTLNILLQILEEGEVQDSKGRKVSFKNAVVIMTSNIGAKEIASDDTLGFSVEVEQEDEEKMEAAYDEMREEVMAELKDHLRPEFINRIDEVIVYRGLNKEDMADIAKLQIADLNRRLGERKIQLDVTPAVVKKIAEDGYSEEFGARNVRRKIQEVLENQLADFILENKLINILQEKNSQKGSEPLEIHVAKRKDDIIFENLE